MWFLQCRLAHVCPVVGVTYPLPRTQSIIVRGNFMRQNIMRPSTPSESNSPLLESSVALPCEKGGHGFRGRKAESKVINIVISKGAESERHMTMPLGGGLSGRIVKLLICDLPVSRTPAPGRTAPGPRSIVSLETASTPI